MKKSSITIILTLLFVATIGIPGVVSHRRNDASASNPNEVSKSFRGTWYGNQADIYFGKHSVSYHSDQTFYERSGNYFVFGPTSTKDWRAFGTPNTSDVNLARVTNQDVAGFVQPVLETYKGNPHSSGPYKVYYYTRNSTDVMKTMTGEVDRLPKANVEGFNME
ncbi:hypothetical protein FAM21834_00381 [Lentilactobacillus parabuchneri]|jgi:hypothetical protein|uniref:Uncharacterized protein n=3 Tax=Lentilactobacillus parabuchneri TaxID=152331 RepID=A0A1X1FHB1_9LACO|nr:hypothetical protein [Lentilactobacillus parabuchneri]APR06650.1 hypothetical protein FAM21731_00435 [Lentilactobacillus parabuchneri]KRM45020.1 hypothetical protein FC51_GL001267 [Lentilactobacillus parabuchneri DSM 5707 = NBRC 107865]KRN75861.1 hypothetical protein IV42_GL000337 [Lentilactobacillus parabuchneri]MBW0223698.1 hypothetical protein [Lentilactobacillus parabuchneri]MBW0246765.1 hypothetical protein [Lentilactobacillus parabuchneri]